MSKEKTILIELQYLPPIQYFAKLTAYDLILIESCENYLKGSYRNRCHLADANGLLRLSVPLKKGKNEQLNIRKVRIAYDETWLKRHWASIRSAYGRAPYFEYYADEIRPLYQKQWTYLFDFNWALLKKLLLLIGLESRIKYTEYYQIQPSDDIFDFRNGIFPKKHRQKKDESFSPPKYRQLFEEKHGFLPNLSILDLLFCTGPQTILHLETANKNL